MSKRCGITSCPFVTKNSPEQRTYTTYNISEAHQNRLSRKKVRSILLLTFFVTTHGRLLKNCSEHSGKLKHASARDSVSRLSLKTTENQWTLVGNHALCWNCLCKEILTKIWISPKISKSYQLWSTRSPWKNNIFCSTFFVRHRMII